MGVLGIRVWLRGEGGAEGSWEEFARMACNMVLAMKGLAPSEKEERGLELKKMTLAKDGTTLLGGSAFSCVSQHPGKATLG